MAANEAADGGRGVDFRQRDKFSARSTSESFRTRSLSCVPTRVCQLKLLCLGALQLFAHHSSFVSPSEPLALPLPQHLKTTSSHKDVGGSLSLWAREG